MMPSFPKPPKRERAPRKPLVRRTRVQAVSSKQRAKIKLRTEVTRPSMLDEDRHRCRACRMDGYSAPGYKWLELNEHPPRSRGGDMNNPAHLITLCASLGGNGCHQKYTAGKLKIKVLNEALGCRALVEFRENDRSWTG